MPLVILDPLGFVQVTARQLAPRLESLSGRRVGLIDNGRHGSDALLERLGELFVERCGVSEVVTHKKTSVSAPVSANALDDLVARCDVFVAGAGV